MTFTVSLSKASARTVTVSYATADGTAIAGQDYTATSGTLSFAPGVTSQTVTVGVNGDTVVEPDETLTLALSKPVRASLGTAKATGTIHNDDTAAQTGTTTKIIWNWGTDAVLNFNPAVDTLDFDWFAPADLSIGEVSGSTRIAIADNNQSYTLKGVRLDQLSPNNITAKDPATLALWQNIVETAKQTVPVSIANSTVAEGNTGVADLKFTVSLNRPFDTTVTVRFATGGGTATAGQDYTATSGTLTFAPGVTAQQLTVPVNGDTTVEYDETVGVTLSNPTGGAKLATASALGAIANDDVVAGLPLATTQSRKVVAAYFPNYAIYDRNFQVADVPAGQLTHLFYAFLDVTRAGVVGLADPWAETQYQFGATESVSGRADQPGQALSGNFNQLAELKQKYPQLHVNVSIGGSTLSGNISTAVATAAGREKLATSIVSFLSTYQMFDGVDFDWEFPGGGGDPANAVSPADGANYAALLALVRTKLDTLGQQSGRRYDLTVASPADAETLATFNLAGLAPSVDFFNVMGYEYHGTWDMTTGHQSALTGDTGGRDDAAAVARYLAAGISPDKIVLGAPMYGVAWSGVPDGGTGGYHQKGTGTVAGSFNSGNYDYKDLLTQLQNPTGGWKLYWDDNSQAPYVYNAAKRIFSTFETPTSIAQKSQWAETLGLRGMMFWDISSDAVGTPNSLVTAAYSSWVLHEGLAAIRAGTVQGETIVGGDGTITVFPASSPM